MLGGLRSREKLRLPEGGVDDPPTLRIIHAIMRRVRASHDRGAWLVVADDEVVGLCSYKTAPTAAGEVEIGFGIASSRRRRGYATAAVRALIALARDDSAVRTLVAETVTSNIYSQLALRRNGFAQAGTSFDAEDGEMFVWRLNLTG